MVTVNKLLIGTLINGLKILDYYNFNKRQYFKCLCFCGNQFSARIDSIKIGTTKSCGCATGDFISDKNKLSDNLGATKLVFRHYKNNAKKRKLKFSLTLEEFKKLIYANCYYCGTEPRFVKFTSSQKNRRDKEIFYNGIDRINNSEDYAVNNCVSCCDICNLAKSDRSLQEFEAWINRLIEFKNVNK